jgi:hypothetical protein
VIRLPDFWSHHFAALKADENRKIFMPSRLIWSEAFDNLYTFGAQGPDFFYYIGKFNPLSKHHYGEVGNQIHELGTQDLFRDMLNFMMGKPSEALMAYIAGFISHYILDVHCHPLICMLGPDSASHKRVELDLEAFCLHDYWGYDKQRLDVGTIKCTTSQLQNGFVNLWQYLLSKNYDVAIDDNALMNGHYSMLRLQKMIVNDTIGKLPFKDFLSKSFHYDLTALRYPDVDNLSLKVQRDYEAFISHYTLGIDETTKALIALDEVLIGTVTVEQYIETFIKFDFLGEA